MKRRAFRTATVAATVAAVLVGLAGHTAGEERPAAHCLPGLVASTAPTALPDSDDPAVCRALPTRLESAGAGQLPVPQPGYHHLGATTLDTWSGILGRLTVRDAAVRAGSYDFVAARFLAKRRLAGDRLAWLEVGWAETGWSGGDAQRIYTFDSQAMSWIFYDGYEIADGDQIWVYLHAGPGGAWRAWLWWGSQWHLLASPRVVLGEQAQLEQYVEVHVDRGAGRPAIAVPPIRVDQVQLRPAPGEPLTRWQAGSVATAPPLTSSRYCLTWENQFDTWSAGDCAATVQE